MNGHIRLPIPESYVKLTKVLMTVIPPLGVYRADSQADAADLKLKGQAQEPGVLEYSHDLCSHLRHKSPQFWLLSGSSTFSDTKLCSRNEKASGREQDSSDLMGFEMGIYSMN